MKRLITLVLGFTLAVPTLLAVPFTFYSTGTQFVGDTDSFWTIISGPVGGTPNGTQAKVTTSIPGPWAANNSSSAWIAPIVDPGIINSVPGTYVYRATFNIPTGYNASTATMTFQIASDNSIAQVVYNAGTGHQVIEPGSSYQSGGFVLGPNITPTGASGWTQGNNTIDFWVSNDGNPEPNPNNPTGFRLQVVGTYMDQNFGAVPEPSTMFLAGAGLFAVAFLRRKK